MKKSSYIFSIFFFIAIFFCSISAFAQDGAPIGMENNLEIFKIYSPHPKKCFKAIPEGPFSLEIKIKNTGEVNSKNTRILLQYAPMESTNFKSLGSIEVPPIPAGKGITLREDNLTYRLIKGRRYKVKAILQYKDDFRKDNIGKVVLTVVSRRKYNNADCTD